MPPAPPAVPKPPPPPPPPSPLTVPCPPVDPLPWLARLPPGPAVLAVAPASILPLLSISTLPEPPLALLTRRMIGRVPVSLRVWPLDTVRPPRRTTITVVSLLASVDCTTPVVNGG